MDTDPKFWPNLDPDPGLLVVENLEYIFLSIREKKFSLNKYFVKTIRKNGTGEIYRQLSTVPTLNGEFLSLILHFMPLIYPVFCLCGS